MTTVSSILEVTPAMIQSLAGESVCVLLDIDNTLLAPTATVMESRIIDHVNALAKQVDVLLCTNNHTPRQKDVAKTLELPILMQAMKPFGFRVIPFLKQHGMMDRSVVVIGDQWVTDGWLAKRLGCPIILVEPMAMDRHAVTRLLRRLEKQWKR